MYSCDPGADSCTNYFSSASYYDTIYSWVGCGDNSAAVSAMRENVTYVAKGYFGYSLDEVTSTGRTVSSSCPPGSVVSRDLNKVTFSRVLLACLSYFYPKFGGR